MQGDQKTGVESSARMVHLVAQHYDHAHSGVDQSRQQDGDEMMQQSGRPLDTKLWLTREFQNHVKRHIISSAVRRCRGGGGEGRKNDRDGKEQQPQALQVADICHGKGGDLYKWRDALLQEDVIPVTSLLIGIDVSRLGLQESRRRFLEGCDKTWPFDLCLVHADALSYPACLKLPILPQSLDIVSCQMALHYAATSCAALTQLLKCWASWLKPGGVLVVTTVDSGKLLEEQQHAVSSSSSSRSSLVKIAWHERKSDKLAAVETGQLYSFTLGSCVQDCPEYVILSSDLQKAATESGFRFRYLHNSGEWMRGEFESRRAAMSTWHRKLSRLDTAVAAKAGAHKAGTLSDADVAAALSVLDLYVMMELERI